MTPKTRGSGPYSVQSNIRGSVLGLVLTSAIFGHIRAAIASSALCLLALVSPIVHAQDYSVSVTRITANFYRDQTSRTIVQTRYCYEYVYYQQAILRLTTASTGQLFLPGDTCDVVNVFYPANLSAGLYVANVDGSDSIYVTSNGTWLFSAPYCIRFAYGKNAVLNLPSGAVNGYAYGSSITLEGAYSSCMMDGVYISPRANGLPPSTPTGPDLVTSSVTTGATAVAGGPLSVSLAVTNSGTASSLVNTKAFIYLSTDASPSVDDIDTTFSCTIGPLAPSAQDSCAGSITVPASAPTGWYYLVVVADGASQVSEISESNNARASATPVQITNASSQLSGLSVSKLGAGTGMVESTNRVIQCGQICGAATLANTQVTLTATPAFGSLFTGWSGGCTGLGACSISVGPYAVVNATFAPAATVLQMPWFTKVGGYISRFVLLNSGTTPETFNINVFTEAGNAVTLKPAATSGTIPPNSQFVVLVDDIVASFSTTQRGMAVISTSAAASNISGIYNLVQPTTGAISNVSLLSTGDLASPTSTLVGPWFTLDPAYKGDFILSNVSSGAVSVDLSFLNASGSAVAPLQTSLTVPANGQRIINAAELAAITGGRSAAAVLRANAPAGIVKGTYKIYNVSTGAASSTELVNPSNSTGVTTTLVVPWFSTVTGYDSRFILTNRGANPASFTIRVLPEIGNAITTGMMTGSIPAGGQVTIPALSVVTATTTATRAGAVFEVQGSPADIEGMYQIVSLGTGAISNTLMARPAATGATSTKLRLPWFSSVAGYISRFVLINRGIVPAPFTIEIVPEQGNAVVQQLLSAGTIPPRGQLVLPVANVLTGFTTTTRAAAVFRITAPDADVDGIYNIVNPVSGSISNTLMLH